MSVYLVEEPCPDCKPYGQGGPCAKHQAEPWGHNHSSPTAQDIFDRLGEVAPPEGPMEPYIEVTVDMLRKVLGEPC